MGRLINLCRTVRVGLRRASDDLSSETRPDEPQKRYFQARDMVGRFALAIRRLDGLRKDGEAQILKGVDVFVALDTILDDGVDLTTEMLHLDSHPSWIDHAVTRIKALDARVKQLVELLEGQDKEQSNE
jgi:hypothetical protein